MAAGHDKLQLYGKGHSWHRSDAERLLRKLVLDQYLEEDMVINKMDLPIIYVYPGKRARELLAGKAKVGYYVYLVLHLKYMLLLCRLFYFISEMYRLICEIKYILQMKF